MEPTRLVSLAALLGLLGGAAIPAVQTYGADKAGAQRQPGPTLQGSSLAPFVTTPQDVVERMLALAGVTSKDVVYDLGSGDGRIPITAAKKYGARGVGVDIDPQRITESRANAKAAGVAHLVEFKLQDAMATDLTPATVVTVYLLSSSNLKLRPMLTKQLRPGARVVSHAFSMGDWAPEKVEDIPSKNGTLETIYLWRADGKYRP